MGETELEEGEALCYHEDEDSTIDPDIDLSYIEEKIQNVLGHFQKDFEGGVSAENLGPKFGGYGSFLPTYQRSPSWSHTRSPQEPHNYDSPRKLHSEDRKQNSLASSSASPSVKPRAASGKAPLMGNSLTGDVHLPSRHAEQSNLKCGAVKKSVNPSDQRTLKVRIKVGSENLSTQKNAEIYSGLGLVVSPSSSMDDSPATSEGLCGKVLNVPEESPTSILQIMTSIPGNLLLSPLSDDLIHLIEKRKVRGKSEYNKTRIESSGLVVNGSVSNTRNQRVSERDEELANQKNSGSGSLLKKEKETDIDTSGCEELISNALKLPLLSSSRDNIADPAVTDSVNASKDGVKGETFSAVTERGCLDTESAQDSGRVDKSGLRLGSSAKISESKKGNFVSRPVDYPEQEVLKAENSHGSDQSGSNVSRGRKARNAEPVDPLQQPVCQNGTGDGLKPDPDKSSTGGKRKQKAVQNLGAEGADILKDQLAGDNSCMSPKSGKSSGFVSKSQELQKDQGQPGDRYKDFFGELEFEEDDNESISGDLTSPRRLKDSQVVETKSLNEYHSTPSKEKFNGNKKSEKLQPQEKYPRVGSNMVPPGKRPSSDAPMGTVPLVNEDWVLCEKCKKWRLLPLGTNPESLPDKWLCKMLTWLPGMNRCNVPEDVTTNTLRALYHPPAASVPAPALEGEHNQLKTTVVSSADVNCPAQEHQNIASQTTTISGKKKHGTSSTDLDGSSHSSNSRKKLSSSGNISNLSKENPSPQDLGGLRRSVDKYDDDNKKDKKASIVNSSDKGTNLKARNKRESDLDDPRASKRIKTDEEKLNSDNGGASSKTGRGSTSGLSNNTSGNDRHKYTNHKDSRVGTVNPEAHLPDDGLLHSSKREDKESSRKKKGREHHASQIQSDTVFSSGQRKRDSGDVMEEMSENDRRKEKKPRVSKSGGKDTNGSKASVGTDKKRSTKDNGQYLSNIQAVDYLKSDIGTVQPSVAANSSSSKVSGSHKKNSSQEAKGSPVESVSSSPLRISNSNGDKARKRISGKDDFHGSGSPRRSSGAELGANDQTTVVKKNSVLTVNDQDVENHNESASEKHYSEPCQVEEKLSTHTKKSGKGISSKGTPRALGSDVDKDKIKGSDSSRDSLDPLQLHEEKSKNRRNRFDEKSGTTGGDDKLTFKKDASNESSKGQNQKGQNGLDAPKSQDKRRSHKQEHLDEKLKKKSDQDEVSGSGKSHSLPPLARVQTEPVSNKENGVRVSEAEAFGNGDALKAPNQRKKAENQNGQPISSKNSTPNRGRDVEAPSPVRRDSSSHAANSALKEAKDLKHLADRLKNSGSTDSIGFYFQAALKFLHGASLLESGGSEGTKHHDVMHAMHIYSSTAKLCEFCAHEYEKAKDMAAASLAYKCMEVAFMRVVYSSHASASRDRNELQSALQIVPPGESPSSSASDVDNLNHQATTDKAAFAKVAGSPQVSGSHVITSRNRSGFLRLINFAQDVSSAMEATRKSRVAFTAAMSRLGENQSKDVINALKKALDFNFQDVEGLLRLVRVAMEAISR